MGHKHLDKQVKRKRERRQEARRLEREAIKRSRVALLAVWVAHQGSASETPIEKLWAIADVSTPIPSPCQIER